jgi:aspartate aminotransferase
VFQSVGLQTETLPWYNRATGSLDSAALLAAIQRLPAQSVVVLQTVGNNPTGCDPSPDEWAQLTQALAAGHHFAFLDVAYPGFVSGCFAQDCAPIRRLAAAGVPLMVAASFGKAFGLYGERVGLLAVPVPGEDLARRVERQMKRLARAETGAQPAFGAAIVETILTDGRLRAVWEDDLRGMAEQMRERRERLCGELERLRSPHDWRFVVEQVGMFW